MCKLQHGAKYFFLVVVAVKISHSRLASLGGGDGRQGVCYVCIYTGRCLVEIACCLITSSNFTKNSIILIKSHFIY